MIYSLFNYLQSHYDFPGAGMFAYISFRAISAFIIALILSLIFGEKFIAFFKKKQLIEPQRDIGLEDQDSKKNTPTIGGVIILFSLLVPMFLFGALSNLYVQLMIITTIWLGIIGFIDDYLKVFKKDKEGLKAKFKIFGQVSLALIVGASLYLSPEAVIRENVEVKNANNQRIEKAVYENSDIKSTKTTIPFVKNNNLDYADAFTWMGEKSQDFGWVLYILVVIFIITAVSNGANITDGLDGLAAGTSAIISVTLGIFAYVSGHLIFASYLNIMYIPGAGELLVFAGALLGAIIGFLWYNSFPAQIFMGDTGSLALGGIIAVFAIIIHKELLIPILCGVFLVENLSVILQVSCFKYTKKRYGVGKRIFKTSPLHHHFQKVGNSGIEAFIQKPIAKIHESKIVARFWIISAILAAITIILLKVR